MRATPIRGEKCLREHERSLTVVWCYHTHPPVAKFHRNKPLLCTLFDLSVGPEHPSSEAARKILQILGARTTERPGSALPVRG
jgi:hypothetical protein